MSRTLRRIALLLALLLALAAPAALADGTPGGLTFFRPSENFYNPLAPQLTREQAVEQMRQSWGAQVIGRVTVDDVPTIIYVRSEATQNSIKIGGLPAKTVLDCVGVADNGWNIVVLPTGYYGFVSGKITNRQPGQPSRYSYSYPIGTATFYGNNGNIYHGYCSTSKQDEKTLISTYYGGDTAIVVGEADDHYCLLNPLDGYMCYVHKNCVSVTYNADTAVEEAQASSLSGS